MPLAYNPDDDCACGHVWDEHEDSMCTIDGCGCIHFESEDD